MNNYITVEHFYNCLTFWIFLCVSDEAVLMKIIPASCKSIVQIHSEFIPQLSLGFFINKIGDNFTTGMAL